MDNKPRSSMLTDFFQRNKSFIFILIFIFIGYVYIYFLREPITSVLLRGKNFSGRSITNQYLLMVVYVLSFTFLVLAIYYLYRKSKKVYAFFNHIFFLINNSTNIQFALLFLILSSLYFLIWSSYTKLSDTAYFGGDTWEYQSMGVNFAYGHGIQKFGGLESYRTYKFNTLTTIPSYYDKFFLNAGGDNFYRTPAYPLFLGIIYKIFGVSPRIAKMFQLLLLVIIAASLPYIGFQYWGKMGLIGGIPAGIVYLVINHGLARTLMTESMISFAVFLVLIAFVYFEHHRHFLSSLILGGSLGFALLVKGSLNLLPICVSFWLLLRYFKNHDCKDIINLLFTILAMVVVILPWTLYASFESGKFIFISTQGSSQLLDDNNEFCTDGKWHPEWDKDEKSFYNIDGISTDHVVLKVINFYSHNLNLFPRIMINKLIQGYKTAIFLWIFIGLVLLRNLVFLLNRWIDSPNLHLFTENSRMVIPSSFWIIGMNFLLITFIFHGEKSQYVIASRFIAPMDYIFELLCFVYGVILINSWLKARLPQKEFYKQV